MASTVLPNGIIIPEKFSRDWYADLYHNWQELDNLLGGGTPKDGTLTIQKNGSTVGTFSANQATNETVNIEVPDVNDGTLTIQQNGTTVDTFTANSSSDKTVNISVPTKTSDLTNDSGFITSDDTKIPLAGSNAISGDLIPSTDGTVNLGGTSYQWNNAYIKSLTINGVACGDILTHNVSEFVNVTSAQTIRGNKYFTNAVTTNAYSFVIKAMNQEAGVIPTNGNKWNGFTFVDKNDVVTFTIEYGHLTGSRTHLNFTILNNQTNTRSTYDIVQINKDDADMYRYLTSHLHPWVDNKYNLGTSTNKWKSFNGLNPGALSLPGDTYIDIDTTNYAWGSNFTFTPDYDGYCFINIGASSNSRKISLKTGRGEYYFSNQTEIFRFTFPVYKGKLVTILTNSSGTESVIPTIRLFPCQGNV